MSDVPCSVKFRDVYEQMLAEDPEFKKAMEELEPELSAMRALIKVRLQLNYTQEQFAKAVGIHQSEISKLERGTRNPSIKFLAKIARALNMDLKIEFVPKS